MVRNHFRSLLVGLLMLDIVNSYVIKNQLRPNTPRPHVPRPILSKETSVSFTACFPSSTSLNAVPTRRSQEVDNSPEARRRRVLLSRRGPHFQLDRFSGKVEFGATANLITKLDNDPNPEAIATWLKDGRGLALSIWDEKLMAEIGDNTYRLQTMKLQFVTIQLSPSVDMKMWTKSERKTGSDTTSPVFSLQSVGFDPNIQLFPGMGVPAESLGIIIEVVGELRPMANGLGVEGIISFQTTGTLPPPMRLLPETALRLASDTICNTIVKFASESFQKGAIGKYREFRSTQNDLGAQQ